MEALIIRIAPNSLPIHSAALYVNENKVLINSTTHTRIQIFAGENTVRINDLGIRLLPTRLIIKEGEIKNIFIGLRKRPAAQNDKNFMDFIWSKLKSLLDLDLQFYILEGL
jgi:hypothetical protein